MQLAILSWAKRLFCGRGKSFISGTMLLVLVVSEMAFLTFLLPKVAHAAVVVIDADGNQNVASHNFAGSQTVFISDQVGYKFFRASPNNGPCVYRKTTNGGNTWGARVTVDSKSDCGTVVVWYDRWTPDDGGDFIHIATMNLATTPDHVWYNRLDTTTDTLLLGSTPVNASTNSGQTGTYVIGTNVPTITKATDGRVYIAISDADDSFVVSCASGCNTTTNWTEVGTSPIPNADDWNIMMPLADGDILLINRQSAAPNNIRSKVWNGTAWTASWTTIDTAVPNVTYDVGMAATLDPDSGEIYLVYAADNDTFTVADHDIRTAKYSSGSWTNTNDVFTNIAGRGLHQVAVSLDQNDKVIYVAYAIRSTIGTATSADIFWATSTIAMSSWGPEQGPVRGTTGNIYGVDLNIMSDERIYVTWYDAGLRDIFGETIADIFPITKVMRQGNQVATVNAPVSNQYLGGAFAIQENLASRQVTGIFITESGTIAANEHLENIRLRYKFDTTAPYDCASVSYTGSEAQYGTTASTFSGADGTVSFSDSVTISPTQALCLYVVVDVKDSAPDGETIKLSIANPPNDVVVTGGVNPVPPSPVSFFGVTTVANDELTQIHYHWRNDDGNESAATSATGGSEDTPLGAVLQNVPKRLRIQVSNEGSINSTSTAFRLEYATAAPTCFDATGWSQVGVGSDWNMSPSSFITDGANSTNIPVSSGGTTPENTTHLTPNGGLRDTSSQTGSLVLSSTNYVNLEFSIVATASSTEGTSYCFRVTNAGTPLFAYSVFPLITVSADVTVSLFGNQVSSLVVPSTNDYVGGAIVIKENVSSRQVTGLTITESGTVNAQVGLQNVKLFYDLATSTPYDCSTQSFTGTEPQFGSTVAAFSGPNGTATFTGSVTISTSQTMCVYVVLDVTDLASNGQTLRVGLANGGNDVTVSSGSVAPSTPLLFASSTELNSAIFDQFGYHWRNDNGTETSATSYTGGTANSPALDFLQNSPIRLRIGVQNTGIAPSSAGAFTLQFGPKITTCNAVGVWTDISQATDDWDLFPSSNITDGDDTTNISLAAGGITDPVGFSFISSNGGVRDVTATTSPIVYDVGEFTEYEYSITSTNLTAFATTYCFRLVRAGQPLDTYTTYPEITTAIKRDFRVQRGTTVVTGTGATLVAGTDYVAPLGPGRAFVRITDMHHTGPGKTGAGGGNQNTRDVTAYISNPGNLATNFTIARPAGAVDDTRVSWEIVEFIGEPTTDNEVIVRDVGTVSLASGVSSAIGSIASSVATSSRVVVYITGIESDVANRNNYFATQLTSSWNASTSRPEFLRIGNSANVNLSYAVVEYTGINWRVQRVEHVYTNAGVPETEPIIAVNSLARTFTHVQKRMDAIGNVVNFGHEVWLSSIGFVSFQLASTTATPSGHVSVAWVIENLQTSQGALKVQRSLGTTDSGAEPTTVPVALFTPISAMNNTSVFGNARAESGNTSFPRSHAGLRLTSTSTYEIWRSESTSLMTFRVETVEWPTTGLAVRQNSYRFFVGNNTLTPTDPWPPGLLNLGENTPLTVNDEPLGQGERIRLRMSVRVFNANLPAGLYNFKLQYGLRVSTCSAISAWVDVGAPSSGAIWRGFDAPAVTNGATLSTNPPTGGQLLLSVSDVAGSYVETNPSPANPFPANAGEDVEYDWNIEHNGALGESFYCFRMVRSDGDQLDGYLQYPQLRTAGFTPAINTWRWYDDTENETPSAPLAAENIAPTDIAHLDTLALRIVVSEIKNVPGTDIKFSVQYDETPLFTNPKTVVASSSCQTNSVWCYTSAAVGDNALIQNKVLSAAASCSAGVGAGCGVHNTTSQYVTGDNHGQGVNREYAFYLQPASPRTGAVYYFRLVNLKNDLPVLITGTSTFPSLVAESASLSFSVSGLPAGTSTASIVTDAETTPTSINFGSLPLDTPVRVAHRLSLTTNATEGYRVFLRARSQLQNTYGVPIDPITGTNATPVSWTTGCLSSVQSCIGYHTTDATLSGITPTRFAADDTYAALSTGFDEVMYSPLLSSEIHDIVFSVLVRELQPAGQYETDIVYIAVPQH